MRKIVMLGVLAALAGHAQAQSQAQAQAVPPAQAQVQAPMGRATADELVEKLAPPSAPLTRSMRNLVPQRRQVDLVVNFDFDSARLQDASRPLLESLAQALNSERLKGTRFKVEGHTDGKGSARYNDELSSRRAQAVAAFLVSQGVESGRLETTGRGFSELLVPDRPDAAENRRVRVIAVE